MYACPAGTTAVQERVKRVSRKLDLNRAAHVPHEDLQVLLRIPGGAPKKDKGKKGKEKKGRDKGSAGAPLGEDTQMGEEQLKEKISYLSMSLDHERDERN